MRRGLGLTVVCFWVLTSLAGCTGGDKDYRSCGFESVSGQLTASVDGQPIGAQAQVIGGDDDLIYRLYDELTGTSLSVGIYRRGLVPGTYPFAAPYVIEDEFELYHQAELVFFDGVQGGTLTVTRAEEGSTNECNGSLEASFEVTVATQSAFASSAAAELALGGQLEASGLFGVTDTPDPPPDASSGGGGDACSCNTVEGVDPDKIHICTEGSGAQCSASGSGGLACNTSSPDWRPNEGCPTSGRWLCCTAPDGMLFVLYDDCSFSNCEMGFRDQCAVENAPVVSC